MPTLPVVSPPPFRQLAAKPEHHGLVVRQPWWMVFEIAPELGQAGGGLAGLRVVARSLGGGDGGDGDAVVVVRFKRSPATLEPVP